MAQETGYGQVAWWGFSPAFDLLHLEERYLPGEMEEPFHVLLVGGNDGRHILKTLQQMRLRGDTREVHFYCIESCLEQVARQLLLIWLAMEPAERMGLQEKTELFLELFANAHVRVKTSEYLKETANRMVKLVGGKTCGMIGNLSVS